MRNLHCSGRFLRFLRSIGAKTACARRAIVALFVVVATILATFMIMPSASMGASSQNESNQEQTQSQTKSENVEPKTEQDVNTAESKADAKGGASASGENGESKSADLRAVESVNPQPSTNPDAPNADHAQNVDSEKKQGAAKEGASKNPNQDVKKDAAERAKKEESAKILQRKRRNLISTRAAAGKVQLPQECQKAGKGIKFFKDCYVLFYNSSKGSLTLDAQLDGKAENISPEFQRYKDKKKKILESTIKPSNTIFKLVKVKGEKSEDIPIPDWVKFKNPDSNDSTSSSDGVITIHPVGKWTECTQYRFGIQVQYPDYSDKNRKTHSSIFKINVNVKKDVNNKDLELKVYNHQESKGRSEVQDTNGVTFTSDDYEGNFSSPITPIFIDSKSLNKPGVISHSMICKKDNERDTYTVNSVAGLELRSVSNADLTSSGKDELRQKQWGHDSGNRPDGESADDVSASTVYKNDPFTERSQSWITGTPNETGDFTCKVFAVKNVGISSSENSGKTFSTKYFAEYVTNRINSNTSEVFNYPDTNIYEAHTPNTNTSGLDESVYKPQKTIDWDVKTLKIKVKSNKKQKLEVKDGDLKLNVYPFKSDDAGSGAPAPSSLSDGGTVSVMKGIELKPFIEATSKADSQKTITLKMLCSKGEKPQKTNAGAAGGASNASKTGAAGFEYTKWVDPSSLGFSFPDDKAQNPCTSNEGEQNCKPDGSDTKFAARTNASATFMSTEDGYYKCVVYALKPDALDKFNTEVAKTGVTPQKISAAFKSAKLTADKDYAQSAVYIHVTKDFTLPHTGGQNWNLQLGAVAAVMVSVLAAGFVISQSEACRKLLYERRRC